MTKSVFLFLKGMAMGAADVVPGVSGGTIAFITGIYDELISSLRDLGDLLRRGAAKVAGREPSPWGGLFGLLRLPFFVPLGLGILSALWIGSGTIPHLIETYPAPVYSFFIGLIVVSAWMVFRAIPHHDLPGGIALVAGLALGFTIGWNVPPPPAEGAVPVPTVFLMGMVAICAMLLPGISGSYILLLFGKYAWILDRVHERDLGVLATFAAGAAIGLLTFSRLLSWLLRHHHATTFSALLGIMVGALVHPGRLAGEALTTGNAATSAALFGWGILIVLGLERVGGAKRSASTGGSGRSREN